MFKLLYKRMYYAICNGITVVFDATNISVKLRKKAIKSCPKDTEKWAVYFVPNVEKAKKTTENVNELSLNTSLKEWQESLLRLRMTRDSTGFGELTVHR